MTTLTPDSLRLIETTQYLRRADEQLSCHLSLRLSFWLKTTHPCNRNYLELEGNLWPLSLSLLFACLHPSSPFFKRDPFFLYSFHLSFFLPCGWTRAVKGWLFLEMGETGPHCGQAGTEDSENALRLEQQLRDERLFRRRLAWEVDTWRMWSCEGWADSTALTK